MKDKLLVYSGGLDSTTMLYEYAPEIALAVSFDYGSNHNAREISCAALNCSRLGIEHIVIPLAFMADHFSSSLLSGPDAIPDGEYAPDNLRSTVVPFRNGIMLAVAAGLAESRGLHAVMLANHAGDHAIYPDCRPEFVDAMSDAIMAGTDCHIRLVAPYTHLTKTQIIERGARLGVDYSITYSCYRGGDIHCATCATCLERRRSFILAGVADPTVYADD